jgi:hypothetical protein
LRCPEQKKTFISDWEFCRWANFGFQTEGFFGHRSLLLLLLSICLKTVQVSLAVCNIKIQLELKAAFKGTKVRLSRNQTILNLSSTRLFDSNNPKVPTLRLSEGLKGFQPFAIFSLKGKNQNSKKFVFIWKKYPLKLLSMYFAFPMRIQKMFVSTKNRIYKQTKKCLEVCFLALERGKEGGNKTN